MSKSFFKLNRYAILAALVLSSLVPVGLSAPAYASGPALTGSSALSGTNGTPISITDLQITDTGNPTEQIRLVVSKGSLSMTTTAGLTFTGSASGAQLKFSGTLTNVNAALATLRYTRTGSMGADTLEVSLVGANQVYNSTTGHLYEYVTSDGVRTWTQAKALADARTTGGATGYLATMTSSEENTYISDRLTGAGWMGASDGGTEGDWKWVDGPETGTSFWSGLAANNVTPGSPVGGQYNAWNSGEPNNAGNEDCGQFLSGTGGQWNDLPCTVSTLAGYVVEYGAPGSLPQITSKNVTLTVTGATHNVSTCAALEALGLDEATRYDTINLTANIDCAGVDFDPMYRLNDGFEGTLNGNNHTISSLEINRSGTAYNGLFGKLYNATVHNLTLDSGSVTGNNYAGGLAGYAHNVDIDGVISRLAVTGGTGVGGLIGFMATFSGSTHIQNSSSLADITGSGNNVGGLIGHMQSTFNSSTVIERTYATGNVTTTNANNTGGLIGNILAYGPGAGTSIIIQDSYARGDVTGVGTTDRLGGLIGSMDATSGGIGSPASITVRRAYASGAVEGDSYVGGLIGYLDALNDSYANITGQDIFATGHTDATGSVSDGAIVGYNFSGANPITWSGAYFDRTGTGLANCSGNVALTCTAVNVGGSQSNYFKSNHTNAPMDTWDFDAIWVVNPGMYPAFAATDDGDGISTADENTGPNSGDANNDGTLDSLQINVASFPSAVTGHYAVLQANCGGLFNVQIGAEASAGSSDIAYNYPAGLMGFVVTDCTAGATATITQYFYGSFDPATFVMRKWNSSNAYTTIPGAVFSTATSGGQSALKAIYQVTDGGAFDQDGLTDGSIADPAGPGQNVLGTPNTGLGGPRR